MTNLPQNSEIQKKCTAYRQLKGITRRELAAQVGGISEATLTQIENGNWDNISKNMWAKVWRKVSDNTPPIFETTDFKATLNACNMAIKNCLMIGITGDTGTGKTTALLNISRQKNVFYVPFDKTMKPKEFFAALLREMGIAYEGNLNQMVNKIAEEINLMESPLIIIDEAGKITHAMILFLQVLRDKTLNNCGIVLAGMPYFKNNLEKYSKKEKEGYAEFYRRVNIWHTLKGLSRTEIKAICAAHQITDAEALSELARKNRFGDLTNDILKTKLQAETIQNQYN